MIRQMLKSKIHRATITDANVNYEGSITIDEALMEQADLLEYEKVLIANINNGSRVETYVIKGQRDSGVICTNGAAALQNKKGDLILIMSFCGLDEEELKHHHPKVIKVNEKNQPLQKV